eukprot:Nk52_evm75s230 gene=Nk52_evmTU75s230
MGKRQHQQDKMYLTAKEWSSVYGGKASSLEGRSKYKRLPFDCCSLTFSPFRDPVCTAKGAVYDIVNVVPYIKKYKTDPVSGEPLTTKDLIKLHFHKNKEGQYHCPVTYKVFNEHSHIVAIKTSGNVFSVEAVEELNIKSKNFKDLLDDTGFRKKDIITLQDPSNLELKNLSNFDHLRRENSSDQSASSNLKTVNSETASILKEYRESVFKEEEKVRDNLLNAERKKGKQTHYSTGKVAASFTSTAADVATKQEVALSKYADISTKAYAQLGTNFGELNIELHADLVPKTCENFIILCKRGFYNGVTFHRNIKGFMIQGGDPTSTGRGGECAWGGKFEDEKSRLSHDERGVLSMANSGPNTNGSQFFITYKPCPHLNQKHTVFGKVVGGMNVLDELENVPVDSDDRPLRKIAIEKATIFVDPFDNPDVDSKGDAEQKTNAGSSALLNITSYASDDEIEEAYVKPAKKLKVKGQFGDFSSW